MSGAGICARIGAGIGVDVGGTSTRVVAYDDAGSVCSQAVAPTAMGVEALVHDVGTAVSAAATSLRSRGLGVEAIGVGVPGMVRDGEVSMALNVGIDAPVPIGELLAERLGQPVWVENDVNAAALGAVIARGGVDDSLALVSIGTGVAAGLVVGGTVVRGAFGAAGEIGHLAISGRLEPCPCGQRGCIEAIASGRAIVSRMTDAGLTGGVVGLWDAASAGVAPAEAIRADVVATLAWAVHLLIAVSDARWVMLGGGVGAALGDRLVPDVRLELDRQAGVSPLLAGADHAARVIGVPPGVELGTLGAFHAARRAALAGSREESMTGVTAWKS